MFTIWLLLEGERRCCCATKERSSFVLKSQVKRCEENEELLHFGPPGAAGRDFHDG